MTERLTAAQYLDRKRRQKKQPRVRNARRTTTSDGIGHDSQLEARRWADLCALERAGMITDLRRQVSIPLLGAHGPVLTPTGRQMHYRADFIYRDRDGREVVEDAKGWETETFQIKRAILAAQGVTIKITKKGRRA